MAELLRLGVVDEKGAMRDHPGVRRADRDKEFVLVEEGESGLGREIVITRRDIGEIQLAKGAIRTGIKVLLSEAGLTDSDLGEVVIAGAFGSYIGIESGVAIGMLPPLPRERFKQVGNAAGMGAKIAMHEFRIDEFRAGKVTIRKEAMIGAFSIIGCGVEIGERATVAAGAIVGRDVPPGATILNAPRIVKKGPE